MTCDSCGWETEEAECRNARCPKFVIHWSKPMRPEEVPPMVFATDLEEIESEARECRGVYEVEVYFSGQEDLDEFGHRQTIQSRGDTLEEAAANMLAKLAWAAERVRRLVIRSRND